MYERNSLVEEQQKAVGHRSDPGGLQEGHLQSPDRRPKWVKIAASTAGMVGTDRLPQQAQLRSFQ